MRVTVRTKIGIGFFIVMIFLLATGGISLISIKKHNESFDQEVHTHEIILHIEQIKTLLIDAETGQRGYVITGLEHYLEPYKTSLNELNEYLTSLRELSHVHHSGGQKKIDHLYALVADKLDVLRETIILRRETGFDAAKEVILTGKGKVIMDDIREVMNKMIKQDTELLTRRKNKASKTRKVLTFVIFFGIILSSIFTIIVSFFTIRSVTTPIYKLKAAVIEIGKGKLGSKAEIKSRDEVGDLAVSFNTMSENLLAQQNKLKLGENKLRESDRELRDKEAFAAGIIDGITDLLVVINPDNYEIISANRALLEFKGLSLENVVGKTCYKILEGINEPCSKPGHKCPMRTTFNTGKIASEEHVHYDKDGTKHYLEIVTSPVFDKTNKVLRILHFSKNITGRKLAESKVREYTENLELMIKDRTTQFEEKANNLEKSQSALRLLLEDVNEIRMDLEKANEELKSLDQLKSMFIASMSHELRTPLNSIIGFTGVILQGMSGDITDIQRKQLDIVEKNSYHLLSLINDVIDISKVEADKVKLQIEKIELGQLFKEIIDYFTVNADRKGIAMSLEIPKKIVIESDVRRLKQILVNLVGNAIKFTDSGTIVIRVRQVTDAVIDISVADTGIGIREDDIDKLFTAFSRIKTEGIIRQGSGLGLYLCKKIVDLLGGRIMVTSEFGKGSVFSFTLPLMRSDTGRLLSDRKSTRKWNR